VVLNTSTATKIHNDKARKDHSNKMIYVLQHYKLIAYYLA